MIAVRYDQIGKLTAIAVGDGYVMVRRPRCMPFVMNLKAWNLLSLSPKPFEVPA